MQGKRVYPVENDYSALGEPGTYGKTVDGWFCRCPNGLLGGLNRHSITEHEDGTITVSPSILTYPTSDCVQWHGFLERGVWREV